MRSSFGVDSAAAAATLKYIPALSVDPALEQRVFLMGNLAVLAGHVEI
jgi:hypothetical protein